MGKILWRRKWQPTPVFLPGESHGQKSLASYSLWGCTESDTPERLKNNNMYSIYRTRGGLCETDKHRGPTAYYTAHRTVFNIPGETVAEEYFDVYTHTYKQWLRRHSSGEEPPVQEI